MDGTNWRPSLQDPSPMEGGGDWRTQLQTESRHRIINKIMDTLKRHLPCSGPDGITELRKIAVRFEEKIFSAATSQSDYLRRISLKMLTMESKSQNNMANSMASNSMGMKNPQDPASQNMQSQVHSQGQSLSNPMSSNQASAQARQQLMMENLQNTIASTGMQTSASLPSTLPPVNGLSQNSMPNVAQNSNLQNISSMSQNNQMGNSIQGAASNIFTNSQKQMQGRQVGNPQQQMQQTQNPQQYMYQQHLQQQMLKQKLNQGNNMQQTLIQPQLQQQQQTTQQQNNMLQSSSQPVVQNSALLQSSGITQNQQSSSMQQPAQSVLQPHQQSVLRHQQVHQNQQGPVIHNQQAQMTQQPMMPAQQQQQQVLQQQQQQQVLQQQQQHHLMGRQSTAQNMQQTQLTGQQHSVSDMQQQQQQQRLLGQQNTLGGLSGQPQNNTQNLQQQQMMGQQNNLSNIHQQPVGLQNHVGQLSSQPQVLGGQSSSSTMQMPQYPIHMMPQSKTSSQQQNPNASGLLPGGGQQSLPQQQMMPQAQSQTPQQLPQQLGLQQQPNSLPHNMQRLQTTNSLLQQQNMIEQQKMFQSQRPPAEAPSTSLDSTAQTGGSGDWQEEVYQKIKVLKDMYFTDLSDMFQKISIKLQQNDSLPLQPKSEQLDKLRAFRQMLERLLHFLQVMNKNSIHPGHKEKLGAVERQILGVMHSNNRPRKINSMQQGQTLPVMQSQKSHPPIPSGQSNESGMNPQLQSVNAQSSSVPAVQPSNMSSLHGSGPSSAITSSQQNIMSSMQPGPNLDPGQGSLPSSGAPQVSMSSLQQNPVSAPQQGCVNSLTPQNGVNNLLNSNINSLHPNSYMLQSQHIKPEQHILQSQQLKQQINQRQLLHKQHLLQQQPQQQQQQHQQQQQLHHQMKQQQAGQMQMQQMSQLHQGNDVNDLKMRPGMNIKSGFFPQHLSQGQRYPHQQPKPGASFPLSSPQIVSAVSPQINQHSSPQIDQQNLLPPLAKVGTPLQSANSPFVVPSPSTPMAPSPMPGDSEKPNIISQPILISSNISHQQSVIPPASAPSLAIGTPGISASPLLAEFSAPDGNQGNALANVSGKSSVTEQPIDRLLKVVKSMSSKALNASVSDIGSVVSMIDRIAGSAPGNGSRAAVGEDLVAMTKCRLQARNYITQDGNGGVKRMRRYTSAMPLNVASSVGSATDSFKQLGGPEASELESTATSGLKCPKIEANPALLGEIREINERLIDTVVSISDEDIDPNVAAAAAEGGEGTVVKCSFIAVALSPCLKAQYASAQMSPIQPLRLLVPANYPNCSPILLDKFPVELSKEHDDLSVKAKSKFSISLRALSQPMSLKDIAKTWDDCARWVVSDYARQSGGGTFSSKYGTWENCAA